MSDHDNSQGGNTGQYIVLAVVGLIVILFVINAGGSLGQSEEDSHEHSAHAANLLHVPAKAAPAPQDSGKVKELKKLLIMQLQLAALQAKVSSKNC